MTPHEVVLSVRDYMDFPPSLSDFTVVPGWLLARILEQFSNFVPLNLMGPIYLLE